MDIVPALSAGHLCLGLIDPARGHTWLMDPIASLAERGSLAVIDAGNHFNAYKLAKAIRSHGFNPSPALQRIAISRSFTCHQLSASLHLTSLSRQPLIVLDLLATFQDENVPFFERRRLFDRCLARLQSIARSNPVLVTAKTNHAEFMTLLLHNSHPLFALETPVLPAPLRLFE